MMLDCTSALALMEKFLIKLTTIWLLVSALYIWITAVIKSTYSITYTVPLLQATANNIITLESQSIQMDCIPTPNDLVVAWMFNGARISSLQDIIFTPINLNHTLAINRASVTNSGQYTCHLVRNFYMPISRTITLEVLQSMLLCC